MARAKGLPELLAPAGSREALEAAIEAGADAVYFGGQAFSNRMRAKNFDREELVEAVRLCCGYGVASHITINTRLRDRELPLAVESACALYEAGASAFIVADVGLAALLKRELPQAVLHGSTQLTGVTTADAEAMATLGFSRMVCPRELSRDEISRLVAASPIEIEMFIHGALCVSLSGQCLMSWAMGGRSGNRGECAQPCRLPYSLNGGRTEHLLSLKDYCLAGHIPEVIRSGVASLKIEGRMKGADYVYGVTRIYRRLLDEDRCATSEELRELESLFSRDGFTDGYYTGKRLHMNGMRPEGASEGSGGFGGLKRTVPLRATLRAVPGEAACLTITEGEYTAAAVGEPVQGAERAPATAESAFKNISRLGGTPYSLDFCDFIFDSEGGAFLPASGLNELRRRAVAALTEAKAEAMRACPGEAALPEDDCLAAAGDVCFAEFSAADQVPDSAYDYFDAIFLPSGETVPGAELTLPVWQTDSGDTAELLAAHKRAGGKMALCHTLGQIAAARQAGLFPVASFRLNTTNSRTARVLRRLGCRYAVLSPELPTGAVRSISRETGIGGAVVYGHLPLMLMRHCIMKERLCGGSCSSKACRRSSVLQDRKGALMTVRSTGDGVNEILNSHVIWSADKPQALSGIPLRHFIFTNESKSEAAKVIHSYKSSLTPEEAGVGLVKRME